MNERDHFNHSMRTLLLHNLHLLLQLPLRNLRFDVAKFMECVSADIDDKAGCYADPWKFAPESIVLTQPDPIDTQVPLNQRPILRTPSDLFPKRTQTLNRFLKELHDRHAGAIPEIALRGTRTEFSDIIQLDTEPSAADATNR